MKSPLTQFDESRVDFKGFNRFYLDTILPFLENKEIERASQVRRGVKYGIIVAIVTLALTAFIYTKWAHLGGAIITAVIGLVLASVMPSVMVDDLKEETKTFLMDNMCGFLGWQFKAKGFDEPDLTLWRDNKLLPRYDNSSFEDCIWGEAHGTNFALREAHLKKVQRDSKGNTKRVTVFKGIMLEIDFHRTFAGRTVVLRDFGIFNFKKKAGMKRVGLVDPKFEKMFEAYSTDQVEARYLLTPTFMQRLVDLKDLMGGKNIRFGFVDGKLHIAFSAPNQFESGSMYKSLTEPTRVQKIYDELGSILDVIDGVIKPLNKHKYTKTY